MSLSIFQFLTGKNILVLLQPAYSPDVSPCDFWLFPKFKETMKGKQSEIIENITSNMTCCLWVIPIEDFQKCFQQWQEHWNMCLCAQVEYSEGD
jgi:hypothetical protein